MPMKKIIPIHMVANKVVKLFRRGIDAVLSSDMGDRDMRHEHHFPACPANSEAPVGFTDIGIVMIIQSPHCFNDLGPNEHKRTVEPLNLIRPRPVMVETP